MIRAASGLQDGDLVTRDLPFPEQQSDSKIVCPAESDDADFFTDQVGRLANLLLCHQTKRKLVERSANHHDIGAAHHRSDVPGGIDVSELNAVAHQRLDLA